VSESTNGPKCRAEALSLAKTLKSFQFLVTLVIWYDLLTQISIVSKSMQKLNMQLGNAAAILEKTVKLFNNFKLMGFKSSLVAARTLAEELDMSPDEMCIAAEGYILCRRQRRRLLSYEAENESVQDPTDNFRINFLIVLMDKAIVCFKERFDQMQQFQHYFGFLFAIGPNSLHVCWVIIIRFSFRRIAIYVLDLERLHAFVAEQ